MAHGVDGSALLEGCASHGTCSAIDWEYFVVV